MFVILSYDVNEKRVSKILKISKKYLQPVQRSLFQGFLNEPQLKRLKFELGSHIDCETDSVVFYKIQNNACFLIDEIGVIKTKNSGIL